MKCRAFSLIELTVVLLILAVVAGTVAVGVRGPMRQAGIERCVEEILAFDRLTRMQARRLDRPLQVVVDLDTGRLRRMDEAGIEERGDPLQVPEGCRVTRLRWPGHDVSGGSASLACSAIGLTPTAAMLVEGAGGRRQWVVLAGLTGQATVGASDEEVNGLMATLQERPHAD